MTGYIYKSSKHRRSGTTMQKTKSRGDQARYDEARRVLPGFPRNAFERREDIEAYISGDKITCLVCGKDYKKLIVHTWRVHHLDAADYRLRFNIPTRYSLAGVTTRTRHSEHSRAMLPDGHLAKAQKLTSANKPGAPHKSRKTALVLAEGAVRLAPYNTPGVIRPKVTSEDHSWHLEVIRTTYAFTQVPVPTGLAGWRTFERRRRADPELQAAYEQARAERKQVTE